VDLMSMVERMSPAAIAVAVVLIIMSMWSIGVAIERIFTFTQARNQSKLFAPPGGQAPQGRPSEGRESPCPPPRTTGYSHLREGRARRPAGIPVSSRRAARI